MIELIIILLLTILNGFFSMSEIALISVKKANLIEKAKNNNKKAIIALKLLETPEKFLSAVQVGITLIGIISGLFGGVALADDIKPFIEKIPFLTQYADAASFIIIVMFITYLSIVIGELFPKSIALNNPLKIALFSAPVISVFTNFTNPLVWFLSFSTHSLQKLFRIKTQNESPVSEDELKSMLKLATDQGMVEKKVNEYIQNIFHFDDKQLKSIMTHRRDIVWFDIDDGINEITEKIKTSNFSQYPICKGELNKNIGVIRSRDFFNEKNKPDFNIEKIIEKPIYLTENQLAIDVLEKFRKNRKYFGIIVNEYGDIIGIVSLHDIIETVLGQFPDINDNESVITKRDDNSYLINAQTKIDELPEFIKLPIIQNANYHTIAGFILAYTNNFPKEGDKINVGNYTIEIVDMDNTVIDKLIVKLNN